MTSICFFNNKGGVGKTTLLCNVASYIATKLKKKVIVLDADPQCNATQLILGGERCDKLYRTKSRQHPHTTLYEVLRPMALGGADISEELRPFAAPTNSFEVDLIPGHPRLALMEDRLSQAWLDLAGGDIGGIRKTNWNTQLLSLLKPQYDYVFIDVGPSLGALNRSVLLGTRYFVTPMGCDIFSLIGIFNIGEWLRDWCASYADGLQVARRKGFGDELKEFAIQRDPEGTTRFAGYTVQQYITKSKGGERRPTRAYEEILEQVPATIEEHLKSFFASNVTVNSLRLPDVPHMYSLVPLAQTYNTPIHRLGVSAGKIVGTQYGQREEYVHFIAEVAKAIVVNTK